MALSKKLKNALKSSPATKPLIAYLEGLDSTVSSNNNVLQNAVDNDTIYDDTEIQGKVSALESIVGDENTDNTLVKDVANLKTSKANSNHTHTVANVTDVSTTTISVTYTDNSTESLTFITQDNE